MSSVGFKKKLRIMKKEYQKPTTFIIPITAAAEMMSGSSMEVVPGPGDEFGVKEENSNTTSGGSIWDNEW